MLAACAVTLVAGFALKAQCITDEPWKGQQYERLCYNDIQPLYELRGIRTHEFPYINAYLMPDGLRAGGIEYPVLTGMFMWASGYLADDLNSYLIATAVLLAPFGMLIAWMLHKMSGARALFWAAAPSLVVYAFHNWDLLVVAAATAALYMWWKGRFTAAAIMIGVGGALKLYPLLFLLPLFLDRWTGGDRRGAGRSLAWGAGTCFALNLPFIYMNPPSWWLTYRFHSLRSPNVDSLWGQTFPSLDPGIINLVTAMWTLATVGVALWWCLQRAGREGSFPFIQACGAVTAAFLVWSKVQSPQYMLWLLPFVVLLRVRPAWWVLLTIVDIAAYVGVFRFYYDLQFDPQADLARFVMIFSVFARSILWAAFVVLFVRSDPATTTPPARELSHPLPRLSPSEA